jgi:lysophospholipase L1-like esterase
MVETDWQRPRRILVYGDSNTWGFVASPGNEKPKRLSDSQRWAGVLQAGLGVEFMVTVDALCGRLTNVDAQPELAGEGLDLEPTVFNGLRHAQVTGASHSPLHAVIVMLGTNDLGIAPARPVSEIAQGVAEVARAIVDASRAIVSAVQPQVLLVAPPALGGPREIRADVADWLDDWDRSRRWGQEIAQVAAENHCGFFDAGTVIETDGVDRIHLTEASHAALGQALVPFIRSLAQGWPG